MNFAPIFLCSLFILLWGMATSRLLAAGVMSAVFVAASLYPTKIVLGPKGRSRVNEATFLFAVAAAFWFWLTRQTLTTGLGLQYVSIAPLVLYPRLLARGLCVWDLSASSISASNGVAWARSWAQRERGGETLLDRREPIDFHIPYLLLCAFSCSVSLANVWALAVSAGAVIAICLIRSVELSRLSGIFSRRALLSAFACLALASIIGAFGGASFNLAVEAADGRFNAWRSRSPASGWSTLISDTSIGKRGQAQMSERLLYRLEWSEGPGYLRRGVYPLTHDGVSWQNGGSGLRAEAPVFPGADDSFALPQDGAPTPLESDAPGRLKQAKISGELSRERLALPLPVGATDIFNLPASRLNVNAMNAASVSGAEGFVSFGVLFDPQRDLIPAPQPFDTRVPEKLIPAIDAFIDEAELLGLPPKEAAAKLQLHFAKHWAYTLRLSRPDGSPRSISDFLSVDRQGHCEYFASAGALIMRRLGFPARYATGFLVSEFDPSEQSYWLRASDSHAWLHYWDGERWSLLDPTVAGAGEENLGPIDRLSDFFSRLQYKVDQFDSDALISKINATALYPILALLALFLGYKIARAKKTGSRRAPLSSAERLVSAVERWCSIQRDPRESASVFWRRAAPLTPISEALLLAADARERALFAPPEADSSPADEALIQDALKRLARAKKPREGESSGASH